MKSRFAVPVVAALLFLCSTALGQSLRDLNSSPPRPGIGAAQRANLPDREARLREALRRGPDGGPETPTLEISGECGGRRGDATAAGNRGTRPPAGRNIRVLRQDVKVSIVDGVAVTEIDQTFHNDARVAVEGTYLCPLPKTAVVEAFSIYERGREIQGVVMGREEARRIYDRITRRRVDPGIIEVTDRGIQTRIFPIPAKGDMRVRTRYAHVLDRRNGALRTSIPLKGFPGRNLEAASFTIAARSSWPLALRTPSGFDFRGRPNADSRLWDLSFKAEDFVPRRDLEVRCLTKQHQPDVALHVHRAKGGSRYFMAVLAAGDRPIRGVELALEGVETADVYPRKLRDLPAKRFVHVFGRIVGPGTPIGVLRGRMGGERIEVPTPPIAAGVDTDFVADLWAVARVRELLRGHHGSPGKATEKEILELSKRHGILTPFTAILAR